MSAVTTLTDYRAGMARPDGVLIHEAQQVSGMTDRPDEDATNAEIARWMEEDFGEALAEGTEQATEEDEDDEHDE